MADSSIYYENAEDFVDQTDKASQGYFPLKRMMKSEFYDSIEIFTTDDRS